MEKNISIRQQLHDTALKAPPQSGVYLWRNPEGFVIYVGKAKNLKNRLSSYFSGQKDIKTRMLISHAQSIEYITTVNEYEAFILENNLIKKYTPRYNINLKDGKSYPVLRITNEKYPRLFKTRRIMQDGSKYFGPFPNVSALDTFIETLYQRYPLRHCKKFRERTSPCMYYHIGRCAAPCCNKITQETYTEFIEEITQLLEGNTAGTLDKLNAEMKEAARSLKFEKAARLRDGINALNTLRSQNVVQDFDSEDRDYIAHDQEGELVSFTVLKMRGGRLYGRDNYRTVSFNDGDDLMDEFLAAYYTDSSAIPPQIFIPSRASLDIARRWFLETFNTNPAIFCIAMHTDDGNSQTARRPEQAAVVSEQMSAMPEQAAAKSEQTMAMPEQAAVVSEQMLAMPEQAAAQSEQTMAVSEQLAVGAQTESVSSNRRHTAAMLMAQENAHEDIIRRIRERGDIPAMEELQSLLNLPALPERIEGFDIAHIGGKFPVASLISFYNGNPDKKNYRYFRLRTTDGVIDDFASMREAASRRYTRLVNEQADLPDLILIDGGIGQVNAVESVLQALNLEIPVIGLAKRDEEIYLPGNSTPVCLPKRSDALRLLQRVRDETHRFATSRNQRLRTKENTVSVFEKLPHIGAARAKALIKKYTSLENFVGAFQSDSNAIIELGSILKISKDEATEVVEAALKEYDARNERKKNTLSPIEIENSFVSNLASMALQDDKKRH